MSFGQASSLSRKAAELAAGFTHVRIFRARSLFIRPIEAQAHSKKRRTAAEFAAAKEIGKNMVNIVTIPGWQTASLKPEYVLGIACTGHGASLALVGRSGLVRASVFDRWIGVKHALVFAKDEQRAIVNAETLADAKIQRVITDSFGRFPPNYAFEEVFEPWLAWLLKDASVQPDAIKLAVSSDSYFATCTSRLAGQLDRWLPSLQAVVMMEHHQVHQRQAFWQSGFTDSAILTLDTCGESLRRLDGRRLAGTIAHKRETQSFQTVREFFFPESSAGLIYALVNHHVGFRQGDEGKTMGLAPYGSPKFYWAIQKHLTLNDDGSFSFLSRPDLIQAMTDYVFPRNPENEPILDEHRDVAFAGQALIEQIVKNLFRRIPALTGLSNLVYAGGLALNSVANGIAIQESQLHKVYIAPNPSDTGQALGCALAGAYEVGAWTPPSSELCDFLGPTYSVDEMRMALQGISENFAKPANPEELVARCIANGAIVATFYGQAEFGPRALGHRSILCDPRRPDMKEYVNAKVKHREAFRPFAPSVLEEHAGEWFCISDRSPYMLRVVSVREGKQKLVPAVVHVDQTARVQTVSCSEQPYYWSVIQAFYQITGVPLVLNTSLNVQGKPIVETPADAVACFQSTEIDVLFMKPFVITKRPFDRYLAHA